MLMSDEEFRRLWPKYRSANATNHADGSHNCSRSDCCILGYGHKGGCIVDPQDIADEPEYNSYAVGHERT